MGNSKVLFIGAGNMGQAIINGMLKSGSYSTNDIYFYEPYEAVKKNVIEKYGIKNIEKTDSGISKFDIIMLAVKPQIFNTFNQSEMNILPELTTQSQVIVSIMAGVSINRIGDFFKNSSQIVRVMPNTPALIGEGMSVLAKASEVSESNMTVVKEIFSSVGLVEVIDESLMDAVTGLSGSGPAFVMAFIESLTQGGILSGLSKSVSEKLAVQTVVGSSLMALSSGLTVEELRHMVTSPGGTTIHGVAALEENGFRNSVIKAVNKAYLRSKELGNVNK